MTDILLATFNSEKYLQEQIDSILSQDDPHWRLLIRDGGSSDSTCQIVEKYCRTYPDRIFFIGGGEAFAAENFSRLLAHSDSDLTMFADHDDVWFPDKISKTIALYDTMVQKYGSGTPVCVFTDALVTDENLAVTHRSNIKNQHLDTDKGLTLPKLLIQNIPSGNTMLFNAALREKISPLPQECVMHDHYITLAAAAVGRIAYLPEPTLFYRQHGKNVLGSGSYSLGHLLKRHGKDPGKLQQKLFSYARQAGALLAQLDGELSCSQREMLADFSEIEKGSFLQKRKILLRHKILKHGFWRNAGLFLFI